METMTFLLCWSFGKNAFPEVKVWMWPNHLVLRFRPSSPSQSRTFVSSQSCRVKEMFCWQLCGYFLFYAVLYACMFADVAGLWWVERGDMYFSFISCEVG